MSDSAPHSIKQDAHALIDELPDTATWDEVVYELAVRRAIEHGLVDAKSGLLVDLEEVRHELLPPA